MQQVTIGSNQAGQRLDKFLHKYLPEAGTGFLYKMLRKKNITLNGKKAEGRELLAQGDVVAFYFAEETFRKFSGLSLSLDDFLHAYQTFPDIQVVYEDKDVVILNKPAGILTQKAKADDISLNEWLIGYLLHSGSVSEEGLRAFKPSVCNRLDRNTSGLVLCGKSLGGSQELSQMIRDRSLSKYYLALCAGTIREDCTLDGYLIKDARTNRVRIVSEREARARADGTAANADGIAGSIRTAYHPLAAANGYTLLEVELITGKPHQIRAHLADIGHPIAGDYKYGDRQINNRLKAEYGLESQLLHAGRVVFPDGREYIAEMPPLFHRIAQALGLAQESNQAAGQCQERH